MFKKIKITNFSTQKIIVYLAVFTSLLYPYRDKDWGWHYRYGEYLLKHGEIMVKDVYSWTMTGYAWTNHSWLFDPILYHIYNLGSFTALAIAGTLVTFLCFYLLTRNLSSPLILTFSGYFFVNLIEVASRDGLRSQLLAFLPATLVLLILRSLPDRPKLGYLLPIIFLFWTNLHGTFVYGLGVVSIYALYYFYQAPKLRGHLINIALLSLICTFLNPFGYHQYLEFLRHTNSPYLRNVIEWLPLSVSCDYCHVPLFSIYLFILFLGFITIPVSISFPYLIFALSLVIPAFSSRRNLPLYTLVTFPFFLEYLVGIEKRLSAVSPILLKYLLPLCLFVTIEYNLTTRLPSYSFYHFDEHAYCKFASGCSPDLVSYLALNPPVGYGFNFYDWGGYFIGKQFPAKLFVDGRMHLWSGKGYTAFGDYIKMYYYLDKNLFHEYNFDWMIIETRSDLANKLRESRDYGDWEVKYQDDSSLYVVRAHE